MGELREVDDDGTSWASMYIVDVKGITLSELHPRSPSHSEGHQPELEQLSPGLGASREKDRRESLHLRLSSNSVTLRWAH